MWFCELRNTYIKAVRKAAYFLNKKFIFKIGTINPYGINERFSFNYYLVVLYSCFLF